jgi:AcrR family transcriptional regulator
MFDEQGSLFAGHHPSPKTTPTMNQLLARPFAATPLPLTRRALAKQRTRRKLLDAAKRLFNERGYEAATVREIATAAGLSTGAVFASFSDKSDLFNAVIADDFETLVAKLASVGDDEPCAEAALLKLFVVAYAFHRDHLPLLKAAIGQAWLSEVTATRRKQEGGDLVRGRLREVLARGVASGEISDQLDLTLTSEMIWDSFIANYRRAIFDGWDDTQLNARLAAQVRILLAGWRAAA